MMAHRIRFGMFVAVVGVFLGLLSPVAANPGPDAQAVLKELTARLEEVHSEEKLQRLGSLMWYLITVKLDMEARGEIERVPAKRPQHIRRR